MKTVLVKRSVEKEEYPKKSGLYDTDRGEKIFFNTSTENWIDKHSVIKIKWWLEEVELSGLIEEIMPGEDSLIKFFQDETRLEQYQIDTLVERLSAYLKKQPTTKP